MHLEVLVEDQSGGRAVELLLEKLLGANGSSHTWRLHGYKGIGHLPKDLRKSHDPQKRILLDALPRLLRGYGQSLPKDAAVVVVVDSDQRDCRRFKKELVALQAKCRPAPTTLFRIAVEEIEAWYLGDPGAITKAYPKASSRILRSYEQDSVCGTWETLAEAVFPGGAEALQKLGGPRIGAEKYAWAERITPHMDPGANRSPSMRAFCDGIRRLIGAEREERTG